MKCIQKQGDILEIFYTVLFILLLLAAIALTMTLRLRFLFNLDDHGMYINILYLYPLIKIVIRFEDNKPFLLVYLLKIRVFKTQLKTKKRSNRSNKGISFVKSANPTHVNVTTHYGFKDPYATGMVCGALSIAKNYINTDKINQFPDFISNNDYIYVDASANIKVGQTIVKYAKNKKY